MITPLTVAEFDALVRAIDAQLTLDARVDSIAIVDRSGAYLRITHEHGFDYVAGIANGSTWGIDVYADIERGDAVDSIETHVHADCPDTEFIASRLLSLVTRDAASRN